MKCPKCGNIMAVKYIENASIPDGDGCADYYSEKYYYCRTCDQWYDEDLDKCDEQIQEPLI